MTVVRVHYLHYSLRETALVIDPVVIDVLGKQLHLDHKRRNLESGRQSVRGLP